MLKCILALGPMGYAIWLSLTRVADYWVDFSDFNAGWWATALVVDILHLCLLGLAAGQFGP